MDRRSFIKTAGVIAGTTLLTDKVLGKGLFSSNPSPSNQPNVLFIMTDQQSYNMMSCMGNKWVKTPNMDEIASKGYRFDNNYCVNPVCMPSRFSLLTGHYASEVGVKENTSAADSDKVNKITSVSGLGNIFRKAGYETLYSGKTHLYGTKDLTEYGFTLNDRDPYDGPAVYAEKWFAEHKSGNLEKPFFMFLSFMNPHDICYNAGMDKRYPDGLSEDNARATKKLLDVQKNLPREVYQKQIAPQPLNTKPINDEDPAMVEMSSLGRIWNDEQWDLYNWMYYRLTESVDEQIGRVLTALKKTDLEEKTIIVFTSDHGEMNRSHGLVHKNVMFEECQRVPFIFAGKGIKTNYVDKTTLTCNGLDFIPTICDLADIKIFRDITGVSLKPYLTGKGNKPQRKYIITEDYNAFQINDGQYKYTIYELPGNPEMLTDIRTDPGETINYASDPSYSALKSTLKKELMSNLSSRGLTPISDNRSIKNIRAMENSKGKKKGKSKEDNEE